MPQRRGAKKDVVGARIAVGNFRLHKLYKSLDDEKE
jgi:hypothetical protein